MATQNRSELKKYFETGDTPTSRDFEDLIDSSINLLEDDISVSNSKIGLGVENPTNKLDVGGSVSIGSNLAGKTVVPANGLFVEGNVSFGTEKADERLTIDGAVSLEVQEGSPSPTEGYGKLFVKKEKITSILFNGSDNFIEINQNLEVLENLKQGTMSMWYRPFNSDLKPQQLIWQGNGPHFQIGIGEWTDGFNDESLVTVAYKNKSPHSASYLRRGVDFFTQNQWYHIVVTVGENFTKVYVDGIEQNVTYTNGDAQTGNQFLNGATGEPIYIGRRFWDDDPALFVKGFIDEISILDQPLSSWDVKKLFENGRRTDLRLKYQPNLVAYWRISETDNLPTIKDYSGNELNGIFKGTVDEDSHDSREVNTLYFKDGDGNELPLTNTSEGGSTRFLWGQKGNNIHFDSGSVGIGTSTPQTALHVIGDITANNLLGVEVFTAQLTNSEDFMGSTSSQHRNLKYTNIKQNSDSDLFEMQENGALKVTKTGIVAITANFDVIYTTAYSTIRILINGNAIIYSLAAGVSLWQQVHGHLYWKVDAGDQITIDANPSTINSMDNGVWSTLSVMWIGVK